MSATPDLIIPVRFDYGSAAADLKTLNTQAQQATRKAADEQVKAAKDAEKQRVQAAKDAAALIAQSNKDLAQKAATSAKEAADAQEQAAKDAAAAETKAAKGAAAAKKQAERDAFQAWKAQQDLRHRQAMADWAAEQKAAKQASVDVVDFMKAGVALQSVRTVVGGIATEFKSVSDYVSQTAKEFVEVQKALQSVAALRGVANSDKFAEDEIKAAREAGLTTEEYTRSQKTFLDVAGAHIGNRPGAKMTADQAKEFAKRLAMSAKASGSSPEAAMGLGGAILEASEGPISVDEAMKQANPAKKILEEGSIDLSRGMSLMREGMAFGGMTPAQVATVMNVVSPAAPGEESASFGGAMRAMEEMRVGGKGEQFGVTANMDKYQALKAFGQNIAQREQALRAQGKSGEEVEIEIARQLKEADVAAEIRERRGLVRGIARQGVNLGGFERFEGIGATADSGTYDLDFVKDYQGSSRGKMAQAEVDLAASRELAGARGKQLLLMRTRAQAALNDSKMQEKLPMPIEGIMGNLPIPGVADTEHQRVNRFMLIEAERMRGYTGPISKENIGISMNDQLTNMKVMGIFDQIEKNTRKDPQPMPGVQPPNPRGR